MNGKQECCPRTLPAGNTCARILGLDQGEYGANYVYMVEPIEATAEEAFAHISFQKGPVADVGINGCHNEDLIQIVLDRLRAYQRGQFRCRQNEMAIIKLEEALHWLYHRTTERQARGVEGKYLP